MDEIELLEHQYLENLKQFELWTERNRDHPDQRACDAYIAQWKTWESQVQQRIRALREAKLQQQSGAAADSNPKTTSGLSQAGAQLSVAIGQQSTSQQQVQQSPSLPGSVSASDMMNFMQQVQLMNQFMIPMSLLMMNMNPLAPPPNFPSTSHEVSSKPLMTSFASMMGGPSKGALPQPQQFALSGTIDSQSPEAERSSSMKRKDKKERKKKRKHHKEGRKRRKLSRSRSSSRSERQSRSKSRSPSHSPSPPVVPAVRNWDRILDMEMHLDPDLQEKLRRSQVQTISTDVPPPNSADTSVPRAASKATTAFTLAGFDFSRPPPGLVPVPAARNPLPSSAGRPTYPPPSIGHHLPIASASFSSPASSVSGLLPPRLSPSILGVAPPMRGVAAGHPRINSAVLGVGVTPSNLKPSYPPNRAYAGFAGPRSQAPPQPRRFPPSSPAIAIAMRPAAANVPLRLSLPPGQLRQPPPVQQRLLPPRVTSRMQSPRQPMLNRSLPARNQQTPGAAAVAVGQRPKPLLGIRLGWPEQAWKSEPAGPASRKPSSRDRNDDDDEGLCSDQDE